MGLGSVIGSAGGLLLSGGNPLGAAGGAAAGQLLEGVIKGRQANKMDIPPVDPQQQAMLEELMRKRQQIATGADTQTQLGMDLVGRGLAQTQANMAKGLQGGALIQGMNVAQRTAGDTYNQILANQAEQMKYYNTAAMQLQDKIAQRKMDIAMWQKLQKMREGAEAEKSGMANLFGTSILTDKEGNQTGQTQSLMEKLMAAFKGGGSAAGLMADTEAPMMEAGGLTSGLSGIMG